MLPSKMMTSSEGNLSHTILPYSMGLYLLFQWDLVCEYDAIAKLTQLLLGAGMFLGATASQLSDRFGRKPIQIVFSIGLLFITLASAFAEDVIVFAVLRFFTGAFQQVIL